MRIILYFLLFFSLFGCKEKHPYPRVIVPESDNVIEVNSKEMLQNISPLLAVNFIGDTVALPNVYGSFDGKNCKIYKGLREKVINKRYDLRIFIDTTFNFASQGLVYKNFLYSVNESILRDSVKVDFYKNKLPFSSISSLQKNYVSCYQVLFYNNSTKDIPLGTSDMEIRIIQEAKDVDNKWKPIEFHNSVAFCIEPLDLLLSPRHYSTSAIIKYKGNFKTKIRVKYCDGKNSFYSNIINGTINRSQFNQKNLKGFYKDTHNDRYLLYFEDFKKWTFLNNCN